MKSGRIRSREVAMELIYQMELRPGENYQDLFAHYENRDSLDVDYICLILDSWVGSRESIDADISNHLKEWKIERISKLELSILRVAITEIRYLPEIAYKVSVHEAVELAKKFCDEKAGRFVNGVLRNFESEKPA